MPQIHPTLRKVNCCPSCASTRIERRFGKSIMCQDCGFELFFNAAAAAGAIISGPDGRIVLMRRAKDPGKGKLGIPGGFIDAFENAEDGVRREALEETGLTLPERIDYLFSCVNSYEYAGVEYASCDVYFHAQMASLDGLAALDEATAFELILPEDVKPEDLAFDSARHAIAAFCKLRKAQA